MTPTTFRTTDSYGTRRWRKKKNTIQCLRVHRLIVLVYYADSYLVSSSSMFLLLLFLPKSYSYPGPYLFWIKMCCYLEEQMIFSSRPSTKKCGRCNLFLFILFGCTYSGLHLDFTLIELLWFVRVYFFWYSIGW